MRLVPFTKMHGLGNDYIYFDCVNDHDLVTLEEAPEVSRRLSDRHFAIGGDGIVLIRRHAKAEFEMRMFNADGSEAEMCGNAIRCVGKIIHDQGYITSDEVTISTGAGILKLKLSCEDGKVVSARVDMGEPILAGLQIPTTIDQAKIVDYPVTIAGKEYKINCVSMGNPHVIIFVDEITDQQVLEFGPQIEVADIFPNRINVEFAKVKSATEIDMRVWERGSGETLACGTGATATAAAAILNNLTNRKVQVNLLGGALDIEWCSETNHLFMTGPATIAFTGTVEI